jgi:CheY-like chemotaxis protein
VRILIADDDQLSRRVLEAALRRFGHQPLIVTNGTDATEELLWRSSTGTCPAPMVLLSAAQCDNGHTLMST